MEEQLETSTDPVNNSENIAKWVKEVFAPELSDQQVIEYKEALTNYYVQTVDYLEYHALPVTKEAMETYKTEILSWTGEQSVQVAPKCSCTTNTQELRKLKKYGIIALAILFLCIIFK